MATRSYEERIAELQKKQEQLKQQERALKAKQAERERKMRTKRLIEVGAIVEKALSRELRTPEERQALLDVLIEQRQSKADGSTYSWSSSINKALDHRL